MTQKAYEIIAGVIFGLVALAHLWRIAHGAPVMVESTFIPMWGSWVAVVVSAILSYYGFHFGLKPETPPLGRAA